MDDPRFAHIKSDPRFRRMPKAQKKAKIDKRFNALFTSKKFKVRTDMDKRGRPVMDVSKRNKHVMERFYDLSDEDDRNDSEDENNSASNENDSADDTPPSKSERKRKLLEDLGEEGKAASKSKKRKSNTLGKVKKTALKKEAQEQDSDKEESESDSQDDASEDDDEEADDLVSDMEESADSDDDTNDSEEEDLPEYTADYDIDETEVEHQWNELHTDALEVSESTHRLAVCNMDWDFVKAQDLFVLFKSFAGEGGGVKSVSIYPSEYGKQRMSEEALLGPKEMRNGTSEADGVNEVEDTKSKRMKNRPMDSQLLKKMEKQKVSSDREKLREYQLNRLRYYYAVVDCDSVSAADNIYKECDGMEYLLSAVKLDLRFIPDDMTFEDELKEMFTDGNSVVDYQPTVFNSTALSQAKVEVTWDETDFDRLSKRIGLLARKELESVVEKNEYADIIAPPESDSEDERPDWLKSVLDKEVNEREINEEEKIQLYRKVLMEKMEEEAEKEKEEDVDQEIEWQPGLKTSVEKKLQSKKHGQSSIVGEYLDKKKEKKKKKKLDKKKQKGEEEETEAQDGNEAFSDDDLPEDMDEDMKSLMVSEGMAEQSVGKKKKKKMKKGKTKAQGESDEMDDKEKAELELLMMDEPGQKNLAKPEVETGKKLSLRKKKKLAKLAKEEKKKQQEEYVLDIDDPRFSALYSSHHFHIDPTAPQYKGTKNMKILVDQQIKKRKKRKVGKSTDVETNEDSQLSMSQDSKAVSKQLLESLKKKMKKR